MSYELPAMSFIGFQLICLCVSAGPVECSPPEIFTTLISLG